MSTIENELFTVREEIPLELHMWRNNLGEVRKKTVIKALGGLFGLLKINPRKDIIEALIPLWDPAHNVFHFADFELTLTLEEIAGYVGFSGNLRNRYPVASRTVTPHKFLDLLSISREIQDGNLAKEFCTFYFLYRRYGNPRGFEMTDIGLTHSGNKDKWEDRRGLAFIVAFLSVLICPRKDRNIELGLVRIADLMTKKANGTIVPMILAEIYRALTVCQEGGNFFEGCNMLLQLWMEEHLFHYPGYMNCGMTGLKCIEKHEQRVGAMSFRMVRNHGLHT
ncbi:protein MAINTENANCE OF MERISTEMS-like [Nicotiana tabacum]|uniref:Protein MAINTENANCE OF MERISTEMS-like n=1 Tax=Nicotiana tabacum TaxID=4097 RepID=A0AC58S5I3_TOBAC